MNANRRSASSWWRVAVISSSNSTSGFHETALTISTMLRAEVLRVRVRVALGPEFGKYGGRALPVFFDIYIYKKRSGELVPRRGLGQSPKVLSARQPIRSGAISPTYFSASWIISRYLP